MMVGDGALDDPILKGRGFRLVKEVVVTRLLEDSQNRSRWIRRQRGWVIAGNAPDRFEVINDSVPGSGFLAAVTFPAVLLEERVYVGEDDRWLGRITQLTATAKRERCRRQSDNKTPV